MARERVVGMFAQRKSQAQRKSKRWVLHLALMAALALVMIGCNEDQIERELGRSTSAAIERTYEVNNNPLISDWCEEIGHTLTAFSTRQQIPYEFKVIDTDMVNAFAAPWGYIYVTQGLLDFADTEDEVIAVMAHEIGHVVNRDSIKSFKKSILYSLAVSIIGGQSETWGDLAGLGLGLLSLRYSRVDEYEADDSGCALAYRAGYNPQGMTDFLHKLHVDLKDGRSASFLEVLLSTHPYTPRRVDRQIGKPWVALSTSSSRLQVAQGYLRRGQYHMAGDMLSGISEQEPENLQLALLLAESFAGRGAVAEARDQYAVIAAKSSAAYPQLALTRLTGVPAVVAVPATAGERQAALDMLGDADALRGRASRVTSEIQSLKQRIEDQLSRARDTSQSALRLLNRLSEGDLDLPRASRRAVLRANAAVGYAGDVVYTLDHFQLLVEQSTTWAEDMGRVAEATLQSVAAGQGRSGTLGLVKSAEYQIDKAAENLRSAGEAAEAALGPALKAQASAQDLAVIIQRIIGKRKDSPHLIFLAQDLTRQTRRTATEALKQARIAERLGRKAGIRGMIATLQLSQVHAEPAMLPGLDKMVAHYMRSTPGQVASLRERGLGYGDIAVILAASKSTHNSVETLAERAGGGRSILDRVELDRDEINSLKVLIKFLARAMIEEVGLPTEKDLPA